ncbi:hypothetical protein M011DRAFT_490498 [Sporormia fimetaria CBS 119925]|uniref:Uncharacterized protein n=1 Tax=Sporormia fimetaria CBS 119925 TaxID=1340428 RepID=A0A6A6UWK8_9PLEO|nr:hypothetical protein M011DRAFT_490498 [Sporormia fimetaria CBS 119925]
MSTSPPDPPDPTIPTSACEPPILIDLSDPNQFSTAEEPARGYRLRYQRTCRFFDGGYMKYAIEEAEASLLMWQIPSYYRIKNHMLLARALDNYEAAFDNYSYAKFLYDMCVEIAKTKGTANRKRFVLLGPELNEVLGVVEGKRKRATQEGRERGGMLEEGLRMEEIEMSHGVEWTEGRGEMQEEREMGEIVLDRGVEPDSEEILV